MSLHLLPPAGGEPGTAEPPHPLSPIVIRFGRLGDMIMLTAVLHLLRRRYGKRCLVLGAGAWNAGIFPHQRDVERIWSFPRHTPFVLTLTWLRVLWVLHRTAPGPIYVCERHPRQLVRVRRLLAWSGIDPARCLFVTEMPPEENEHWVDRFLRFGRLTPRALRATDYPPPPEECRPAPSLSVADEEQAEIDAWINAQGGSGKRLVLVQPGNFRSMSQGRRRRRRRKSDDKAWPIENWVQLLEKICARLPDALIVLCGAPPEAAMLQQIQTAARRPEVLVAALPLRPFFALCVRAHSMVSVDTGPAHAAAALGLPLVVIFGAEPQHLWLPRGPSPSQILGVGGPPASVRVDQIPVDDVFRAWCALESSTRPDAGAADSTANQPVERIAESQR